MSFNACRARLLSQSKLLRNVSDTRKPNGSAASSLLRSVTAIPPSFGGSGNWRTTGPSVASGVNWRSFHASSTLCNAVEKGTELPKFKDVKPPMPPPPNLSSSWRGNIVEPPIRSRPFRMFKASRNRALRRNLRRVAVKHRNDEHRHPFWDNQDFEQASKYGSAPVQAVHAAGSIDLASVVSKVFPTKTVRKMMERLSVVVQLPDDSSRTSVPSFVAVFRFGPVVFFNVEPREAAQILVKIKQHAKRPVISGHERKENFCVHVQPELIATDASSPLPQSDGLEGDYFGSEEQMIKEKVVTGDYCIVQELNMKSVDVISNVMAQSVALDSYGDMVDELLANFGKINDTVMSTGSLTTAQREGLFRTVAHNNHIAIDMVSKLGIKDRSDTAWNLSQYEDIYAGMKDEFEIDTRFDHIEFKLDLIQQNAKFFIEVLHNQKSNSLEWIIIVLITFECALMCAEMSGAGQALFSSFGNMIQ